MKVKTQAIHPAMVEGVGGRKGGVWWVDTADRAVAAAAAAVGVVTDAASAASERAAGAAAASSPIEDEAAVRLRARDGARPAMVGEVGDFGPGGGSDRAKSG